MPKGFDQDRAEHFMAPDVEPPALASIKLANGETVYVELSPEGQRRMSVEGTTVELSNSDVAERHRSDEGTIWMSLNRLQRLRRNEYLAKFCRGIFGRSDLTMEDLADVRIEEVNRDFPKGGTGLRVSFAVNDRFIAHAVTDEEMAKAVAFLRATAGSQ